MIFLQCNDSHLLTIMDPFFARPNKSGVAGKKRKRANESKRSPLKSAASSGKGKKRAANQDEELDVQSDAGSSNFGDNQSDDELERSDKEDRNETPAQKRLRLAKKYLENLQASTKGGPILMRTPL